jgi:hypothetical protein
MLSGDGAPELRRSAKPNLGLHERLRPSTAYCPWERGRRVTWRGRSPWMTSWRCWKTPDPLGPKRLPGTLPRRMLQLPLEAEEGLWPS